MNLGRPNELQRRAVDEYLKAKSAGGKVVLKDAFLKAGYSPKTAANAYQITHTKGFQEILREQGLTQESFASYLSNDIRVLDPRDRLGHLKLLADILGVHQINISYSHASETAMNLLSDILDVRNTDNRGESGSGESGEPVLDIQGGEEGQGNAL